MQSHAIRFAFISLAGALASACSDAPSSQPLPVAAPTAGSGVTLPVMPVMTMPVAPPTAAGPIATQAGSAAAPSSAGSSAGVAGAPAMMPPLNAAAGQPAMMGQAGTGHAHDPCIDLEPVAAQDAMLTSKPEYWRSATGTIDLLLPRPVLEWMDQRLFREGHDAWHAVRKCFSRNIPGLPTSKAGELCQQEKYVAPHQECTGPEDGYQFLLAHRHMIQVLRQAFPQHADLFAGFPKFPFAATDVPEEWRDRWGTGWSRQILDTAETLEDIENQLERFPTEGALGQYIQCGGMANGASSIHGALHFKWVVNGSPAALGDQRTNLGNYMFWKLHGWIDHVWERWRVAKGLKPDDPALKLELVGQCREMHQLAAETGPATGSTAPPEPLPEESGYFHDTVRPILEETCSGCHSGTGPEGGLILGGQISSQMIVRNLVGVASVRGGQFQRVVPRDPDKSWLYLKPAGLAATAGCTGTCNAQVMPPTGMVTLSQAQLEILRKWIMDGAPAPTSM